MNDQLMMYLLGTATVVMEILSGVVMLVLFSAVILSGDADNRRSRLFSYTSLVLAISMFLEAATWLLETREGMGFAFLLTVINFLSHSCLILTVYLYISYIFAVIAEGIEISPVFRPALLVWSGLCEILVVASLFNGMIFYIDGSNLYQYGPWWWLFYCFVITMLLAGAVTIFCFRKTLGVKDAVLLLIYTLLPLVGFVCQALFINLMLGHVLFMLAMLIVYLNLQSQQGKRLKEQELALTKSRMAVMLSQIQPHFLYNSLSAIEKLCDVDVVKAKAAINDFAHYLRGNLDSIEKLEMVPFEDELEHVKTYVGLEKLRFGDKLRVNDEIMTQDFMLPPLTIQPLVENAIRYGVTKKREGGTVTIAVNEAENDFEVVVADDGVGFDVEILKQDDAQDGRSHIGIENVRGRLETLCGGSLTIHSQPNQGTTATITIPKNVLTQRRRS